MIGEFKLNKTYCMDCLEGLKKIPDNSVNVVLTSVPFKEEDVERNYWNFMDKVMKELFRVTLDYLLIFQTSKKIFDMCNRYKRPFRIAIWSKPIMLYCRKYNPIFIYEGNKPSFNLNKKLYADVFPFAVTNKKYRKHKYEDPLLLYIDLLSKFPSNFIVLDPFMGSGVTAFAALSQGMKFIGFEINPKYVKIANKRLAQEILC